MPQMSIYVEGTLQRKRHEDRRTYNPLARPLRHTAEVALMQILQLQIGNAQKDLLLYREKHHFRRQLPSGGLGRRSLR